MHFRGKSFLFSLLEFYVFFFFFLLGGAFFWGIAERGREKSWCGGCEQFFSLTVTNVLLLFAYSRTSNFMRFSIFLLYKNIFYAFSLFNAKRKNIFFNLESWVWRGEKSTPQKERLPRQTASRLRFHDSSFLAEFHFFSFFFLILKSPKIDKRRKLFLLFIKIAFLAFVRKFFCC
jgi:hypothetical protein